MANLKVGFDYYNIDTNRYQDIRIKRLKKDFGCSGISVYDYILCEIYRVKGCFIAWDESTAFDVADYFGIKESLVNEIVNYCGVVGLFDKALLADESIITSLSIQKRYLDMSNRAKRSFIEIPKKVKIQEESNINQEESNIIQEESNIIQASCRKVKESKEKEKREREETPPPQNPIFEKVKLNFNLPLSQCKEKFLSDELHIHRLKVNFGIDVPLWIDKFFIQLENEGVENKSVMDAKSHFTRWFQLKQKEKTNGNNRRVIDQTQSHAAEKL